MKLFISADIEGCAGVALAYETHKNEAAYGEFAKQMTKEVVAACEAAHEAGADEIVVKDGHGDATNIDPLCMPDYVTLIRGKSGHPYNMMSGLDDSFDGVMYIGYHAPAGNPGFAISHTSTGNSLYIRLNGSCMSEFMLNSYTAASHKVPVLFLSGDSTICGLAGEMVPDITTALAGNLSRCSVELPETFTYEVTYKDWKKAYQMSFYPGMRAVDTFTNRLETARWMDVVTAHCFVIY